MGAWWARWNPAAVAEHQRYAKRTGPLQAGPMASHVAGASRVRTRKGMIPDGQS
jgi:hypothetical protein